MGAVKPLCASVRSGVNTPAPPGGVNDDEPREPTPGVVKLTSAVRRLTVSYRVFDSPLLARGSVPIHPTRYRRVLMFVSK